MLCAFKCCGMDCYLGPCSFMEAIRRINRIGKKLSSDVTSEDLQHLGLLIDEFDNEHVLYSAGRVLGNLCMFATVREQIVASGVYESLIYKLEHGGLSDENSARFLATIWNLLLAESARDSMQEEFVRIVMKIIDKREDPNVIRTAFGCLSNLCLSDHWRILIGTKENCKVIIQNANQHGLNHGPLAIAILGLIANMTIDDQNSIIFMELNIFELMKKLFSRFEKIEYINFKRNMIYGIRNMCGVPNFINALCENLILEELYKYNDELGHHVVFGTSLDIIFNAINVSAELKASSFHIACQFGLLDTFKSLIRTKPEVFYANRTNNLTHSTVLDYAFQGGDLPTITYLVSIGMNSHHFNLESIHETNPFISDAIKDGERIRKATHLRYTQTITPIFPVDYPGHVLYEITDFLQPVDMQHQLTHVASQPSQKYNNTNHEIINCAFHTISSKVEKRVSS